MSIRRMTMCKFCKFDNLGANIGKPLMRLSSQTFGKKVFAEAQIVAENFLAFSIYTVSDEYFTKEFKIKYCPMCGRKLKSE